MRIRLYIFLCGGIMKQVENYKPRFHHFVWLFIVGCVLGVIVEGIFSLVDLGAWESHVTFLWGHLNIVYGAGACLTYVAANSLKKSNIFIEFVVFMILASVVEWIAGYVEEVVLNSTSWNYGALGYLTIAKYISVPFSIAWGILGVLFIKFVLPLLQRLFMKMNGRGWIIAAWIVTAFMIVNFVLSMYSFYRWGDRETCYTEKQFKEYVIKNPNDVKGFRKVNVPHRKPVYVKDKKPTNDIDRFFDKTWNDEFMHNRYMEWVINSK